MCHLEGFSKVLLVSFELFLLATSATMAAQRTTNPYEILLALKLGNEQRVPITSGKWGHIKVFCAVLKSDPRY